MPNGPQLPGVETEDTADRIVLHVDADCFYAACERLREPELRDEPVVVGMGYEPGDTIGAVATASYEAREFGVESAQAISTALESLPRRAALSPDTEDHDPDLTEDETGYYRPVDMDFYESVAADVREILHDCADIVREVSIDEAYLDVTERTAWEVADGFARHVKDRIRREVGVVVSIGVAPTMSAAKIASDFDKPDGLTVVEPGAVREFLAPLDVELLHGVGPVTARELREMGLETAADVAAADPDPLVERFGERGQELYDRARGEDERRVEPKGDPKSFSRESAFAEPVSDPEPKYEQIETLAAAVADRAQREGALYRTVGIKAVLPPFDVNTRARSLPGPVDDPDLVERITRDLFAEFETEPVRKLGVRVANLEFATADQTSLDGWDGAATASGESEAEIADVRTGGAELEETEGLESGSGSGSDPDSGSESETASDARPESESDTGPESNSETDAVARYEFEAKAGSEAGSEPEPEPETEPEPEPEPHSKTESSPTTSADGQEALTAFTGSVEHDRTTEDATTDDDSTPVGTSDEAEPESTQSKTESPRSSHRIPEDQTVLADFT
ncbi:DNA polymerase IV [Natrialba hulunbeirensis JCM 10989]|uniref:DNA polymerase IV n=1 Tax=Natrialba hulunbeirensis JCM 10989 TaxID=1227493 RepID=M0A5W6_9EURY|nr:DNA polymerase IV [Natrialba hulunbeirensis]ELY94130.1 DNA polymerase IV [Natrialba hulunbeirensis JCM 10989]